jgi:putative membrane protein
MWWNGYWPMPWMFFPIIFMAICMAMMFLMMRGGMHRGSNDRPIDILKERYARGEITQAEYEDRRRFLQT